MPRARPLQSDAVAAAARRSGPEGQSTEEKHSAKARTILLAAARIFNERGYHETSMSDVAKALGVSKPYLYYYLKNKERILAAAKARYLRNKAILDAYKATHA